VSIAEHIAEGHSPSSIVRTCKTHHDTVERIARVTSEHAIAIHQTYAVELNVTAVQADECWGFAGTKKNQLWEATLPVRCMFRVKRRPYLIHVVNSLLLCILVNAWKRRFEVYSRKQCNAIMNPQSIVLYSDCFV
jgi:hypothetical protein